MDWVQVLTIALGTGGGIKVLEFLVRGLDKRARALGRRESRLDVLERSRLVLWDHIYLLRHRMRDANLPMEPLPRDPADPLDGVQDEE